MQSTTLLTVYLESSLRSKPLIAEIWPLLAPVHSGTLSFLEERNGYFLLFLIHWSLLYPVKYEFEMQERQRRCEGGCQSSASCLLNALPSRTVTVPLLMLCVARQLHQNCPPKQRGSRVTPLRFTSLNCWMTFRCGAFKNPSKVLHYNASLFFCMPPNPGSQPTFNLDVKKMSRLFYNCCGQIGFIESAGV